MICRTCLHSPLRGYIVASSRTVRGRVVDTMVPCLDCQGSAIAHCCDGDRAQPEPRMLGHVDLATTQRYAKTSIDDVPSMMEAEEKTQSRHTVEMPAKKAGDGSGS